FVQSLTGETLAKCGETIVRVITGRAFDEGTDVQARDGIDADDARDFLDEIDLAGEIRPEARDFPAALRLPQAKAGEDRLNLVFIHFDAKQCGDAFVAQRHRRGIHVSFRGRIWIEAELRIRSEPGAQFARLATRMVGDEFSSVL